MYSIKDNYFICLDAFISFSMHGQTLQWKLQVHDYVDDLISYILGTIKVILHSSSEVSFSWIRNFLGTLPSISNSSKIPARNSG